MSTWVEAGWLAAVGWAGKNSLSSPMGMVVAESSALR
jgi:hypothetical protein